jgi:hypothetical protein
MMKRILQCSVLLACTSISFADFEYDVVITASTPYEYGSIDLLDQSLLITGSGASNIEAREAIGKSYIEVRNTSPLSSSGGITTLLLDDTSELLYIGGETDLLLIYDCAIATISGGSINMISSYQTVNGLDDRHIEMIVRDYDYDFATNILCGTWNVDNDNNGNWDTFNIKLLNQSPYPDVINNIKFTITPEPTALVLFGLGGLLLRRKRR